MNEIKEIKDDASRITKIFEKDIINNIWARVDKSIEEWPLDDRDRHQNFFYNVIDFYLLYILGISYDNFKINYYKKFDNYKSFYDDVYCVTLESLVEEAREITYIFYDESEDCCFNSFINFVCNNHLFLCTRYRSESINFLYAILIHYKNN